MQLLDAPLAIVDLETTGAHPAHDRVTEIAVIEVDGGEVTGEWSTLVNPETAIPAAIQALTGITNDMVAGAPRFARARHGTRRAARRPRAGGAQRALRLRLPASTSSSARGSRIARARFAR